MLTEIARMMGMRSSRTPPDPAQRAALIAQKLQEIDKALSELSDAPELAGTIAERPGAAAVKIVIGNSEMAARQGFISSIVSMVNQSYGCMRLDEHDVMDRLQMGDAGSSSANRVLHLAMLGDRPVGCMSSTFKVPWAENGCGHWGLLVVDTSMQGQGIASAMVAGAERRLAGVCEQIQIEYEYTAGDTLSERLLAWYEGKCRFQCVSGRPRGQGTEFRKCRKKIPDELQRLGERERLRDMKEMLSNELSKISGAQ